MNLSEVEKDQISDHGLWFGKMCQEHSAATEEKISGQCYTKPRRSPAKKAPLFLSLKTVGLQQGASLEWVMGGDDLLSPGVYSMHSFGECPSVDVESHLSQILEACPQEKYYLSEKACLGILRRAEKRGKTLPPMLKQALHEMILYWGGDRHLYDVRISSDGTKNWRAHCYETDISRSLDTAEPNPDSNHGGVAVVEGCLNPWDIQSKHIVGEDGKAETLYSGECRYGGGEAYVMQRATPTEVIAIEGNGSRPSHRGDGYSTEDVMYTLNSTEHHAVAIENHPNDSRVKLSEDGIVQTLSGRMGTGGGNTPMVLECFSQDAYDKYTPNKVSATIKNTGGVYGGGSEVLIVQMEENNEHKA